MKFELLHIWGPFAIHSYGLFIALGIFAFTWLIKKHKQFTQLKLQNKFIEILMIGIISGLVGGRLLSIIIEPETFNGLLEMVAFWQGGFSVLGSLLGVLAVVPWYLKKINVPILPLFDLAAIYAPLLQSIARLGCFFAGCCHGITAKLLPWAIIYTDPQTIAPLHVPLHPTQLYSSATLLGIFILMYFVIQHKFKKPGQLLMIYLMLASTERFIIDFWRADRVIVGNMFSFTQLIALGIVFSSAVFLSYAQKKH